MWWFWTLSLHTTSHCFLSEPCIFRAWYSKTSLAMKSLIGSKALLLSYVLLTDYKVRYFEFMEFFKVILYVYLKSDFCMFHRFCILMLQHLPLAQYLYPIFIGLNLRFWRLFRDFIGNSMDFSKRLPLVTGIYNSSLFSSQARWYSHRFY